MIRGYIYKIWSLTEPNMVYYGSTKQKSVAKRIAGHKCSYKSYKEGKTNFTSSYSIFDIGDWSYMTLEHLDYDEPYQLKNRERYYVDNNECVNKQIPNRTDKEYREQNMVQYKEYQKQWREKNREYQKQWREQNRGYHKQWHEQNKERLKVKQNEKITCECGCVVKRGSLSNHKKTKKHIMLMQLKAEQLSITNE